MKNSISKNLNTEIQKIKKTIEILQSIPCLDQVCIDVIRKSKWRPARQGRQKVGVPLSMPFNFTLEN